MEFNVGDRVRCKSEHLLSFDKKGTIEKVGRGAWVGGLADVVWSDGKKSTMNFCHLELIKPTRPKVEEVVVDDYLTAKVYVHKIIYAGPKTILLYKDNATDNKLRRSIARCNYNDTYDTNTGITIAFNRAVIARLERELAKLTK